MHGQATGWIWPTGPPTQPGHQKSSPRSRGWGLKIKNNDRRDLPGGTVDKDSPASAGGHGPGRFLVWAWSNRKPVHRSF